FSFSKLFGENPTLDGVVSVAHQRLAAVRRERQAERGWGTRLHVAEEPPGSHVPQTDEGVIQAGGEGVAPLRGGRPAVDRIEKAREEPHWGAGGQVPQLKPAGQGVSFPPRYGIDVSYQAFRGGVGNHQVAAIRGNPHLRIEPVFLQAAKKLFRARVPNADGPADMPGHDRPAIGSEPRLGSQSVFKSSNLHP